MPEEAYLVITDRRTAREKALEAVRRKAEHAKLADAIFPHSPDMAIYTFMWYDALWGQTQDPEELARLSVEGVRWARECVKRSPEQPIYHDLLAKALWRRGQVEEEFDYFKQAIDEYERATLLYPIRPELWEQCGEAKFNLGTALVDSGQQAEGAALIKESEQFKRRGRELRDELAKIAEKANQ